MSYCRFVGGYNLTSICDASEMCTRTLLGENVPLPNQEEILRVPHPSAIEALEECSKIQGAFAKNQSYSYCYTIFHICSKRSEIQSLLLKRYFLFVRKLPYVHCL